MPTKFEPIDLHTSQFQLITMKYMLPYTTIKPPFFHTLHIFHFSFSRCIFSFALFTNFVSLFLFMSVPI